MPSVFVVVVVVILGSKKKNKSTVNWGGIDEYRRAIIVLSSSGLGFVEGFEHMCTPWSAQISR